MSSRVLKIFLALSGLLGISTIAFCSFVLLTSTQENQDYHAETILATKIISCSKKVTPSQTFWTNEKFKF